MRAAFLGLASLLAAVLVSAEPAQQPLTTAHGLGGYAKAVADSLFKKAPANERVSVKHHHGWCDPHAKSHTGHITMEDGGKVFFYFFESRSKPDEDPLVLWLNGGPGQSAAIGVFLEHGPCRINTDASHPSHTEPNPHSWTQNANVLFIDQPLGVGFSKPVEEDKFPHTSEAAGEHMVQFLDLFFESFPKLNGRPFHMAGGSYAGRYLPVFASAVYDHNFDRRADGLQPINLQSLAIANGGINFFTMVETTRELWCTKHIEFGRVVAPIKACMDWHEPSKRCTEHLKRACLNETNREECQMLVTECSAVWFGPAIKHSLSFYNMEQACTVAEGGPFFCNKRHTNAIQRYLMLPAVREMLGVEADVQPWAEFSPRISAAFGASHDLQRDTSKYLAELLERGVRVLNFAGTLDAACSHLAIERALDRLQWWGQPQYLAAPTEDWTLDGDRKGLIKRSEQMTFVKMFRAGHYPSMDKPAESLALINAWLQGSL